ncbi:MFS transporter [Haliea sp.]
MAVGVLTDHVFAPHVLIFVGLIATTGCTALVLYDPQFSAIAAVAIGFSPGAEADSAGLLVAKYLGPESYGRVFGWQYTAFIIGVGIGPIFMGALYDVKWKI